MKKHCGFTLIEMAIVLALIALLLGTGLTVLTAQQEQRRIEETNTLLSTANEALMGYALAHSATGDLRPYLPCPDKTTGAGANDGVEDRTASACDTQEGNLPWATLGLNPSQDLWSNRLRYRVTAIFSNGATGMQLTSLGDMDVLDAAAGGTTIAANVPAIVISHGKNGLGAINASCNPALCNPNPPATGANELANAPASVVGHTTFISHPLAATGETGGEFDDQVIWLSKYILFNRMVQAGKLP